MKFRPALLIILVALITGCHKNPVSNSPAVPTDVLFQYSTLGSLMAGVYDGNMTLGELKKYGDFGLGTFNALDGEMIEIDHQVYRIRSDGKAYAVNDTMKTPFSVVTFFETDQQITISEPVNYAGLKEVIDSELPTVNIPYAIKSSGTFSYMKTRSVPRQQKPYPPLLDVLQNQPTFEFENVDGVIFGFRLPDYMDIANAPGYHFHFITADRSAGGHVLEFQLQNLIVNVDYTDTWQTVLPSDEAFYNTDISGEAYQ